MVLRRSVGGSDRRSSAPQTLPEAPDGPSQGRGFSAPGLGALGQIMPSSPGPKVRRFNRRPEGELSEALQVVGKKRLKQFPTLLAQVQAAEPPFYFLVLPPMACYNLTHGENAPPPPSPARLPSRESRRA